MNTQNKTMEAQYTPPQTFTMEHDQNTLVLCQKTTLKSKNLQLTKAKAKIITHKQTKQNEIEGVKNALNPVDVITAGTESLWKILFPNTYIFYKKPEELPDSLDLNEERYQALQKLQTSLMKRLPTGGTCIEFLREQLLPVMIQNNTKVQDEMKLKYACLRENTTYYGQKTETKLEQSYSMAAKYLTECSLYAMQKAVDDYVAPKLKGKWNPNMQQHEDPEYPFPPLGELRSKLQQYHRLGTAFLHNCEFILSIDITI